jgi:Sulfatase-modifying factor enzyme 1
MMPWPTRSGLANGCQPRPSGSSLPRGGFDGKRYPWGDEFRPNGKWMANTWQGMFPVTNTAEDGFTGTSPVKSFPPNDYGLYDMAGNVWQWCRDWYRVDAFTQIATELAGKNVCRDTGGPSESSDPADPNAPNRVVKGGSFLCNPSYFESYRPSAGGAHRPIPDRLTQDFDALSLPMLGGTVSSILQPEETSALLETAIAFDRNNRLKLTSLNARSATTT